MEVSSGASSRSSLDQLENEGSEETHLRNFELESSDHQFRSMSALEILRESVRILRCNASSFLVIAALLICPVSAILLSNVLVDQSIVKRVTVRLAIIISNIAMVVSVLEGVSGPKALLRSSVLIRGQTQVGLLIFLESTIGSAFVQGLFEHRVKTLSYGDWSSRICEGPVLAIMYSFVGLIDLMMSAVFYFSCTSYSIEASDDERHSILETIAVSAESVGIPSHDFVN